MTSTVERTFSFFGYFQIICIKLTLIIGFLLNTYLTALTFKINYFVPSNYFTHFGSSASSFLLMKLPWYLQVSSRYWNNKFCWQQKSCYVETKA